MIYEEHMKSETVSAWVFRPLGIHAVLHTKSPFGYMETRYEVWQVGAAYRMCIGTFYDITKAENVTRIEYPWLLAGSREEYEGGYYTFFIVAYSENYGVLGVSEQSNEYICILYPYKDEEEEE